MQVTLRKGDRLSIANPERPEPLEAVLLDVKVLSGGKVILFVETDLPVRLQVNGTPIGKGNRFWADCPLWAGVFSDQDGCPIGIRGEVA